MKKVFLPLALLLIAVLAFAACTRDNDEPAFGAAADGGQQETPGAAETPAVDVSGLRIALVAHSPESILDDGSFNAGAWQGILQFARANGLSTTRGQNIEFFQPGSATDEARIDLVENVVQNFGADIVVLPGFHFVASSYEMQRLFPDVKFVLLDASPAGDIASNLVAIHYAEHESGFLAGYAIVMDGFRNLGFMGGAAVPAVVRFGHGFLQGAEYAANALGLSAGDITVRYYYIGGFAPDPGVTTQAGSWYATGTEVIFAAAGGAGFSIITAAEAANAYVIGVDVDQADASDVVITSAVKGLATSVNDMLNDFVSGNWRGGRALMFDATVNGIGLPMESSRFRTFSQAQYDAIFGQLASGAISVNNSLNMDDVLAGLSLVVVEQ